MIAILILKCLQVKRTMDVHIKVYTITTSRPCTYMDVLLTLPNLPNCCDFPHIPKDLKLGKNGYTNICYHNHTKGGKISSFGLLTFNKRCVYNIGIYRKAERRMYSYLNTNSRLLVFMKYKTSNSCTLYINCLYWHLIQHLEFWWRAQYKAHRALHCMR